MNFFTLFGKDSTILFKTHVPFSKNYTDLTFKALRSNFIKTKDSWMAYAVKKVLLIALFCLLKEVQFDFNVGI